MCEHNAYHTERVGCGEQQFEEITITKWIGMSDAARGVEEIVKVAVDTQMRDVGMMMGVQLLQLHWQSGYTASTS